MPLRIFFVVILIVNFEDCVHGQGEVQGRRLDGLDNRCRSEPVCKGSHIQSGGECSCDDECISYGDCCQDAPILEGFFANASSLPTGMPHIEAFNPWSCVTLNKSNCTKSVYVVTQCPETADSTLATRCSQEYPPSEDYSYLQDLPVKSLTTGRVYRNIFCAKCHMDAGHLHKLSAEAFYNLGNKNIDLQNFEILQMMEYAPGNLTWTIVLTEELNSRFLNSLYVDNIGEILRCDVHYHIDGRKCTQMESLCVDTWIDDEVRRRCSIYKHRVDAHGKIYKNWECAVCNNVPVEDIKCAPKHHFPQYDVCNLPPRFSVADIFTIVGECSESQVWSYIKRECETVTCGSLFKLVHGKCVKLTEHEAIQTNTSLLYSACFTRSYPRNESISYQNGSLFLNSTRKMYATGEYEFAKKDQVRVCRELSGNGRTTFTLVSTVALSMSLACMFLHLIIFLSQSDRSSVPTLSHACMVTSLFLAQSLFLVSFKGLSNLSLCITSALFMDYFFTASFLWMSVISFDLCRAFRSRTFRRKSMKTFMCYFVFASAPSFVKTVTIALLGQLTEEHFFLNPNFGRIRCWYNKKWSLILFFLGPVFIILTVNIICYVIFIYEFYKQQKASEFAAITFKGNRNLQAKNHLNENNAPRPSSNQAELEVTDASQSVDASPSISDQVRIRLGIYQRRIIIYSKVALVMGLPWMIALISAFKNSIALDYLNIVFNSLQGLYILLAFDCKIDKWKDIIDSISSTYFQGSNTEYTQS